MTAVMIKYMDDSDTPETLDLGYPDKDAVSASVLVLNMISEGTPIVYAVVYDPFEFSFSDKFIIVSALGWVYITDVVQDETIIIKN